MDALEALNTRRSIRQYTAQPVAETLVEQILAAGMQAPSANNEQPWEFVVVRDPAKRAALSKISPYAGMASKAPVVVLVCGDVRRETAPGYWMIDCAAATENMLLAAHALGLGAVWLGVYPRSERMAAVRQLFALPDPVEPFCLIALGYPAETKSRADRFDRKRIHYENW